MSEDSEVKTFKILNLDISVGDVVGHIDENRRLMFYEIKKVEDERVLVSNGTASRWMFIDSLQKDFCLVSTETIIEFANSRANEIHKLEQQIAKVRQTLDET